MGSPSKSGSNIKKKKQDNFMKNMVICLHNLGLCLFSVLCFINTVPIFYNLYVEGFSDALCQSKFYDNDKWWYWTYLFYLSKYYEFLDTYILIWKGREPS